MKADTDPLLDPFIPTGPSKPPRHSAAPESIPLNAIATSSATTSPFNYDPFGDDFDTKPIVSNANMPQPPPHDPFQSKQLLPPAPALYEFSLLLSSTQTTGMTANGGGGSSAVISASDSDLDSFFDSLQHNPAN